MPEKKENLDHISAKQTTTEEGYVDTYDQIETDRDRKRKMEFSSERLGGFSKVFLGVIFILTILAGVDFLGKSASQESFIMNLPFIRKDTMICNYLNGGLSVSYNQKDVQELQGLKLVSANATYSQSKYAPARADDDVVVSRKVKSDSCLKPQTLEKVFEYKEWKQLQEFKQITEKYLPDRIDYENFTSSPIVEFITKRRTDTRLNYEQLLKDFIEVTMAAETSDSLVRCDEVEFKDFYATFSCSVYGTEEKNSRNAALAFLQKINATETLTLFRYPESIDLQKIEDEDSEYNSETRMNIDVIYTPTHFESQLNLNS